MYSGGSECGESVRTEWGRFATHLKREESKGRERGRKDCRVG